MRKHLVINYEWKEEDNEIFVEVRMDRKRSNIIKSYEKLTNKVCRIRKTSASPGNVLKKNKDEPINIEQYRSMVGKFMFYYTKVSSKIVNATR